MFIGIGISLIMSLLLRALALLLLSTSYCWGASISFLILDKDNQPIPDAIVSLFPTSASGKKLATTMTAPPANMKQTNKQFRPHVVVVQKGQKVNFPNQDSIKHQVYSLSDLQQFDLTVEAGESQQGPEMQTEGAINIGCNIHDWMQAYVYVVNSPWFAQSGNDGKATLAIPDNETFEWRIWHPRMSNSEQNSSGSIGTNKTSMTIKLQSELLPAYDEVSDFDDFDDY